MRVVLFLFFFLLYFGLFSLPTPTRTATTTTTTTRPRAQTGTAARHVQFDGFWILLGLPAGVAVRLHARHAILEVLGCLRWRARAVARAEGLVYQVGGARAGDMPPAPALSTRARQETDRRVSCLARAPRGPKNARAHAGRCVAGTRTRTRTRTNTHRVEALGVHGAVHGVGVGFHGFLRLPDLGFVHLPTARHLHVLGHARLPRRRERGNEDDRTHKRGEGGRRRRRRRRRRFSGPACSGTSPGTRRARRRGGARPSNDGGGVEAVASTQE